MGKVVIKEPAEGGESNAVKKAKAGDQILFPHVDSCMGVVFFLDNGEAIGGHVPMMWGEGADFDPAGNFERITRRMQALIPSGVGVASLMTYGDPGDLEMYGASQKANTRAGAAGGVDIEVDVSTGKAKVTKCR